MAFLLLNGDRQFLNMSNGVEYLDVLQAAILIKHECKPTHKETVRIQEKTKGNDLIWEGDVEVFSLAGHKNANTCYAWQHVDSQAHVKIFAVLKSKLIDSPAKAVRAAIFTGVQPPFRHFSDDLKEIKKRLGESRQLRRSGGIKSQDVAVPVQAARGIKENIKEKRTPPN